MSSFQVFQYRIYYLGDAQLRENMSSYCRQKLTAYPGKTGLDKIKDSKIEEVIQTERWKVSPKQALQYRTLLVKQFNAGCVAEQALHILRNAPAMTI
eukprot:scaffold269239_cov17-Tisochrysis_lutea.AAC.1